MMKNRLHSVIRKCSNDYGFWGGYLQPMEVITLYNSNLVTFNDYRKNETITYARRCKKDGICNPTWVYFQPKPDFLELHRGLNRD